jgi:hypothetical protein
VRRTILVAIAASAITGAAASSMIQLAAAQQTPSTEQPMPMMRGPGMMPREGMGWHPGWMNRMHEMMAMRGMHRPFAPGTFALFPRDVDRHLSGADAQKIAEALLLWHGNHSWKVADVVENPDTVGFAYTAPDGTVIARFTIQRKTGRIARVG